MTTRITRHIITALSALMLTALGGPGFAQDNLLINPGFDENLDVWDILFGRTANWSSRDAAGSPGSGSALVLNELNPSNGGTPLVLSQCVSALPSTGYSFGGRLLVPAGQPVDTAAQLVIWTFASGDCTGEVVQSEFESASSVEEWELETDTFVTDSDVHSISFALGVFKPNGETATASGHFDNLFLRVTAGQGGFPVNPSMSASWFNPAEGGHGILIHLLDAERAWMCWFTFDLSGNPAWICALGSINGDTLLFPEAFTVEGGKFPPLFDPAQIVEVPWGSITVTFSGCDTGNMEWSTDAAGFQSGSMPLVRLTPLWDNDCS